MSNTEINPKKLIKALTKYIKESSVRNETYTFRGLISFIGDELEIDLDYFSAQDMGLLDFNNEIFKLIENENI